MVLAIKAACEA